MDTPKISYWISDEGQKPIADLSKEELIAVVEYLARENETLRRNTLRSDLGRFKFSQVEDPTTWS